MTRRLIGAGLLVGIASTMVIVPNAAAQDDSQITLTVGLLQDLDSPNVTAGYLVSSFELWNLQYATLTDKAADDFATIPGLAESWEASDDGLTYTYTLREGLQWSDGEPLTAEDIAYTINTSRDEEWINHSATTVNLDATAIDDRTVQIVTSVPDPKLPTMDVYIVPKHIWETAVGGRDRHLRRPRRCRVRARSRCRSGRPASRGRWSPTRTTGAGRRRPSTGSCSASSPTRTRWWPRCRRARSTPPT